MPTFAQLLREYTARTGVSDAELARAIGVRRQTVFRWKEGLVAHPRSADEVRRCAAKLRLSPEERDALLMAAGFPPCHPLPAPPALTPEPAPAAPPSEPTAAAAPPSGQGAAARRRRWLPFALVAILVTAALGAWVYVAGSRNSHPQAQPDETLIVIGQFSNYTGGVSGYNVAGRLQEALERELDAGRLPDIRAEVWPRVIADEQAARDAARHSGAALVIWGEYDSGRAVAHFTTHPGSESSDRPDVEKQAASPDELAATINSALPEEVRSAALFTVGQILIERGDLKRARALLSQAAARPPADPVALAGIYHLLAFTYERGADADIAAAVDYYTRAIDLNPTMVSAFNNRGAGYLRLGGEENVRRAIADLDRVIEQAPELVEPHLNRGLAYIRLGQTAAWQRDLEAALTLKPDHTGAHNALCWAHALSEQPEAALVYCDRALELDPEGPALDSRAIAYARLGRYPEAQADFEAYLAALERDRPDVFTALETRYRGWLDALAAGRNPFDAALIEQLRVEP